jgi:hypothetical protein
MDRMIIRRGKLEGCKQRVGLGARGDIITLAHHQIIKPPAGPEAMIMRILGRVICRHEVDPYVILSECNLIKSALVAIGLGVAAITS